MSVKEVQKVTIHFAGDSGDGIQLAGSQFTNTTALAGNDLSTFPDFPAEIRAPIGTVAGVSGFQIHFGSVEIDTPGGKPDVLVAMNAAAYRKNLPNLKAHGVVIANTAGFDKRNLKLAGYPDGENPLERKPEGLQFYEVDITKLNRQALAEVPLSPREKDRSRNMFALGLTYFLYSRNLETTLQFFKEKFAAKPDVLQANTLSLKAGYHYGDTIEALQRYSVQKAKLPAGEYRNITGNQALSLGLIAAAQKSSLGLFYAGYPITPASDILHELARHKNFGVKTFQAEDEIAAITAAIGSAFAGGLAVTATSGPGMALKTEGLGLALMLELPLVVVNVQRGGPSTGLPTKTEQSDLLQALYGRNGEAPVPVLAASSPADCFETALEACKIAVEHMTPVILLSDGYLANGSEPWAFPKADHLPTITAPIAATNAQDYQPYARNKNLVRRWALPGTPNLEHRLGGLEKEEITGNVSYDADNHQKMVKIRAAKVKAIAQTYPASKVLLGPLSGDVLVVGWGNTKGAIKVAVSQGLAAGFKVAQLHLRHINPLPSDIEKILKSYRHVLVPELNNGQLVHLLRSQYLINATALNKIKGQPFRAEEIFTQIKELLTHE